MVGISSWGVIITLPFYTVALFIAVNRDYFYCTQPYDASWARNVVFSMASLYSF